MGQRITGPALLLTILLALAPVWAQPAPEPAHESRRAWLGCWTRDGDDGSLAVVALYPSGPAERAGLRVGDLLLSMNDRKINDQATLATWLAELEPGEVTRFAVLRDGVELPIEIPLGELADAVVRVSPVVAPDPAVVVSDEDSPFPVQWGFRGQRWIGLELVDLTAELRKHYGA
ncbi:MAG: PDZ domain-containing protein, partial [Acidobacteriota bacterium]|nr:PDZ domain-containing protein [Acidobacteriota bacterium]